MSETEYEVDDIDTDFDGGSGPEITADEFGDTFAELSGPSYTGFDDDTDFVTFTDINNDAMSGDLTFTQVSPVLTGPTTTTLDDGTTISIEGDSDTFAYARDPYSQDILDLNDPGDLAQWDLYVNPPVADMQEAVSSNEPEQTWIERYTPQWIKNFFPADNKDEDPIEGFDADRVREEMERMFSGENPIYDRDNETDRNAARLLAVEQEISRVEEMRSVQREQSEGFSLNPFNWSSTQWQIISTIGAYWYDSYQRRKLQEFQVDQAAANREADFQDWRRRRDYYTQSSSGGGGGGGGGGLSRNTGNAFGG